MKMGLECEICEERLPSVSELQVHCALHDDLDRVVCRGCGAESTTLAEHRLHQSRCFPCRVCGRSFPTSIQRDDHMCLVVNGQPLVCACHKSFERYADLVEHARGDKPFNCCMCVFTSHSLRGFIRHIRKHSQQRPYQCPQCARAYSSAERLSTHLRRLHEQGGSRMPCSECGKLVPEGRMEAHRARHQRSSCLCPECGKMFHSHCRLSQHLSTHYPEPVTCDTCQKVLKTKKILLEHLKTHLKTESGNRVAQAVCPMCGLELAQKGSLARHILLVHERHRFQPKDVPRTCSECNMTLPNSAQYYTHRRQHRAALERFICCICSREFNKKQNLLRHIYLLHDERRIHEVPGFSCDLCRRLFREKRNLVRHYKLIHKLEMVAS